MKFLVLIDHMLLRCPLVVAICLNVAFLVVCLGFGGIHFGSLDDYFMSAIITGAYGGVFDPHTLFVNGVYAFFLRPFYWLFPVANWYFVFEMFAVLVSFTVFTYFLLRRLNDKMGLALSVFILACLVPDYYLQLAFTQCAAASTAAAILLFFFGNEKRRKSWIAVGGVLLIVGIVFRREGFLLGMPFLAAMLVLSFWETRKIMKTVVVTLVVCVCAYQMLQNFNNALFESDEYSYYRDYQWSRSVFGDGANYDIDAVYDEMEEREMQGRDFWFLRSWIFYDTKVLSLDSLKSIVNIVNRNRFEVNPARMSGALFLVIAKSFFKANAWCWIVLCFLFYFFMPKRGNLYTWGSFALMSLCLGFLLYVNRVVYHVESGIWLYAIVCAIPLINHENPVKGRHVGKLPYLIGLMAIGSLVLALTSQREINNDCVFFGTPKISADWDLFVRYTQAHPDDVFLLYFNDYKYLATYKDLPYKAVAPHSWGNIIPIGYWNINLPGMKRELEKRGVQNPIEDLIKDNVFVLAEDKYQQFDAYYNVHYHKKVSIDTVVIFGELVLQKYHVEEP